MGLGVINNLSSTDYWCRNLEIRTFIYTQGSYILSNIIKSDRVRSRIGPKQCCVFFFSCWYRWYCLFYVPIIYNTLSRLKFVSRTRTCVKNYRFDDEPMWKFYTFLLLKKKSFYGCVIWNNICNFRIIEEWENKTT